MLLGWQTESWEPAALDALEAVRPPLLKVFGQAAEAHDLIRNWHGWRGSSSMLVTRLNRGDDTSLDPGAVDGALDQAGGIRDLRPIVEVPVNEGWQTSAAALAALGEYSIMAMDRICRSGFDCCIGNLGEGNPPNLADWAAFVPALRRARWWWSQGRRVYLGLHEYWLPPSVPVNDGWHSARYARLWDGEPSHGWAGLPEDARIPILIGELGIDGGLAGARRQGWRTYQRADWYGAELRAYRDAAPSYVHGGAVFLCGARPGWGWEDFEIAAAADVLSVLGEAAQRPLWVPGVLGDVSPEKRAVAGRTEGHQGGKTEIFEGASVATSTMTKRAYLHQFDQLGESSIAAIAATLRRGGIGELACKSHQATNYLGNGYDSSRLAIRSPEDVRRRRDELLGEGIRLVPWCVPMGLDVEAEADVAARVAEQADGLIELDLEPYEGFWEGPYGALDAYLGALERRGIRYELNIDARPGGWQPFGLDRMEAAARRAEVVWTQTYWRWFQAQGDRRSTSAIVADALELLDRFGVPRERRGMIFGYEAPEEYGAVADQIAAVGVRRIGLWRMGTAAAAAYDALAAIGPVVSGGTVTPAPKPTRRRRSPVAPSEAERLERELWGPLWRLKDTAVAHGRPRLGGALLRAVLADKRLAGVP